MARERRRDTRRRHRALSQPVASVRPVHDRITGDGGRRRGLRREDQRRRQDGEKQATSRVRRHGRGPVFGHGRRNYAQTLPMVHQVVRVRQAHVYVRHHTVLQVRAQHVLSDAVGGRHGGGRERDASDRGQVRWTVDRGRESRRKARRESRRKGRRDRRQRRRGRESRQDRRQRRRRRRATAVVQTGNGRRVWRRRRPLDRGRPHGGRRAVAERQTALADGQRRSERRGRERGLRETRVRVLSSGDPAAGQRCGRRRLGPGRRRHRAQRDRVAGRAASLRKVLTSST